MKYFYYIFQKYYIFQIIKIKSNFKIIVIHFV